MRLLLLALAAALAACDAPQDATAESYVVDVFAFGPAASAAPELALEAEQILGLDIQLATELRPGVVAVTITDVDPEHPDGAMHHGAEIDDCYRVAWANSAHSLAHELGHALGLDHIPSAGNLMSQPEPGFVVTDEQLDRMALVAGYLKGVCR